MTLLFSILFRDLNCIVIGLKSRTVAHKTRTKFLLKFVRAISTKMKIHCNGVLPVCSLALPHYSGTVNLTASERYWPFGVSISPTRRSCFCSGVKFGVVWTARTSYFPATSEIPAVESASWTSVYWPGFKAIQVCCCFATLSVTGRGLSPRCRLSARRLDCLRSQRRPFRGLE